MHVLLTVINAPVSKRSYLVLCLPSTARTEERARGGGDMRFSQKHLDFNGFTSYVRKSFGTSYNKMMKIKIFTERWTFLHYLSLYNSCFSLQVYLFYGRELVSFFFLVLKSHLKYKIDKMIILFRKVTGTCLQFTDKLRNALIFFKFKLDNVLLCDLSCFTVLNG